MSSLKLLVERLVDYAGLFPPATLPLDAVLGNYQEYLNGSHRWMLGRLIIPAGRLAEFSTVFQQQLPAAVSGDPWKISALLPVIDAPDQAFDRALHSIDVFNNESRFARVDVVEGRLPRAELINETIQRIPGSLTAFLEIPHARSEALVAALAEQKSARIFAKIRTGGVTPDLIPDSRQVAEFIEACARHHLGFKATAGLHHPLRGEYPLTYDADARRSTMHGFLNVFVAACFAHRHRWPADKLATILNVTNPRLIEFGPGGVTFASTTVDRAAILATRQDFAISFGSCSFTEPVDELQQSGWLETDRAGSPF